jgi:hypothetical protein
LHKRQTRFILILWISIVVIHSYVFLIKRRIKILRICRIFLAFDKSTAASIPLPIVRDLAIRRLAGCGVEEPRARVGP